MKPLSLLLLTVLLSWLSPFPAPAAAAAAAVSASALQCHRLEELLGRLSELVDFYASDPDRVNSDGYFGMRLSRDLLAPGAVAAAAAARCGSSASNWLDSVLARQDLLAARFAENLADRAGYDGATFSRICQPMAQRFQRLTGAPRPALISYFDVRGVATRWPGGATAVSDTVRRLIEYDEPRGDACLVKALQTDGGCRDRSQCSYFDRPLENSSGYYLTHQLLYKMINDLNRCGRASGYPAAADQNAAAATIPDELNSICRKVLSEFKLIGNANWTLISRQLGNDPVTGLRDLYMEQALLCGLVGVKDFYNDDSVATVTSWQDPQLGCFKLFNDLSTASELTMRRKILRDVEMLGGCSAHSTGVAMGFYSNAIRYLLGV